MTAPVSSATMCASSLAGRISKLTAIAEELGNPVVASLAVALGELACELAWQNEQMTKLRLQRARHSNNCCQPPSQDGSAVRCRTRTRAPFSTSLVGPIQFGPRRGATSGPGGDFGGWAPLLEPVLACGGHNLALWACLYIMTDLRMPVTPDPPKGMRWGWCSEV